MSAPDLDPHNVVIDCADHSVVVPFWEAALGWTSHPINDQFVALRAPADKGIGFDILFHKVPEPKVSKNRAHIDFDAATWRLKWSGWSASVARSWRSTALATSTGRSSRTPKATSSA
jgi:hypothetical protein